MNPHDRYGFQFKRLLAGSWDFESTMNDRDYNEMPGLLIGLVNNLGFALEERALDPYQLQTLPFPDFSYAVVRTSDKVVVVLGRGPVQSVRYGLYYDLRQDGHPTVGEESVERLKADDLHWDNYLSARFPSDVMMVQMEQRDVLIREEAQRMADELIEKAAPGVRQGWLKPVSIFPAGPFIRRDNLCFVLMPFADEFQEVYDYIIKPTVEATGLECQRADDIMESGDILAQIFRSLMQARLVIADLTGSNGNVLYELGLAHMIGHQAILLTQEVHQVPFDLRQQRLILYSLGPKGLSAATRKLDGAITSALSQPPASAT
jgi:hypothetical protein